jgi:hypothetical protein
MGRIAVIVALLLCPSVAQGQSAQEMRSACREIAAARVMDHAVTIPQSFDSGVCWGAFAVVQTAVGLIDAGDASKLPFFRVCAPKQSTRTQLIAIFVEYARVHPESLHEEFFFVAIAALRTAFPCN